MKRLYENSPIIVLLGDGIAPDEIKQCYRPLKEANQMLLNLLFCTSTVLLFYFFLKLVKKKERKAKKRQNKELEVMFQSKTVKAKFDHNVSFTGLRVTSKLICVEGVICTCKSKTNEESDLEPGQNLYYLHSSFQANHTVYGKK